MPRALKNLDISLGLAVIPVQLFTATSSQGVAFHLLHAKCGSRIQMRLECPIHGIVPREETVKGYEISKDEYVRFEPEELKALEQASSSALVIDSFVLRVRSTVYFEDTYYLGARETVSVAIGYSWSAEDTVLRSARSRGGKTTPIAIRAHQDGLLLQRLYFADEVENAAEIDQGAEPKIHDQGGPCRAANQRAIRDRVPSRELRGRVPEAGLEGDRTEDRGSGDPADRGRGPAPDD
jgi:DNA end-binding protein Ku